MDYKAELSKARERWAYWSGQYNDLAAAYHTDITALEAELVAARAPAEALRRENAALRARMARDAEDVPVTPERARAIAREQESQAMLREALGDITSATIPYNGCTCEELADECDYCRAKRKRDTCALSDAEAAEAWRAGGAK